MTFESNPWALSCDAWLLRHIPHTSIIIQTCMMLKCRWRCKASTGQRWMTLAVALSWKSVEMLIIRSWFTLTTPMVNSCCFFTHAINVFPVILSVLNLGSILRCTLSSNVFHSVGMMLMCTGMHVWIECRSIEGDSLGDHASPVSRRGLMIGPHSTWCCIRQYMPLRTDLSGRCWPCIALHIHSSARRYWTRLYVKTE